MNKRWLIALLFAATLTCTAQPDDFLRRSHLFLSGGGMNYIGDLNNQSAFGMPDVAYGLGLRTRLDNRWAVRYEVTKGSVHSNDYLELRNLSFRSDIYEANLVFEFSFWNFGNGATDKMWAFYLFGGVGAFYYNPMGSYTDGDGNLQWVRLQPLHTEGQSSLEYPDRKPYRLIQMAIPFGVGIKMRLSKAFTLNIDYGFRKTWTDYLDDVSTTYVGADVLNSNVVDPEIAVMMGDRSGEVVEGYVNAPGIKRGDDSLDDWYACLHMSLGISLETLLGWTRSKRCKL